MLSVAPPLVHNTGSQIGYSHLVHTRCLVMMLGVCVQWYLVTLYDGVCLNTVTKHHQQTLSWNASNKHCHQTPPINTVTKHHQQTLSPNHRQTVIKHHQQTVTKHHQQIVTKHRQQTRSQTPLVNMVGTHPHKKQLSVSSPNIVTLTPCITSTTHQTPSPSTVTVKKNIRNTIKHRHQTLTKTHL